jgi:hypothetical protein
VRARDGSINETLTNLKFKHIEGIMIIRYNLAREEQGGREHNIIKA